MSNAAALMTVIGVQFCLSLLCFHAAVDGGALYGDMSAHLAVLNSTLRANKASFGGAIALYGTAAGK